MDVIFQIESKETFTQVLNDILDNLYDCEHIVSNETLDLVTVKMAKEEVKNIILDSNLNTNEINELLSSKCYDNDRLITFTSLLEDKRSVLANQAVVHYNCAYGETLTSFNWKLKLVCGTSELKTYSYPLLQLALYAVTKHHKPIMKLHELNKDVLARLIGVLEELIGDKMNNEHER